MRPHLQTFLFAILIGCAAADGFAADTPADQPIDKHTEVSIPFANHGGIYDWEADGEQGVYIQGRNRKDWYYATFLSPCIDLPTVIDTIGFKTEPTDEFDEFSAVVVKGRECKLVSLTRSDPPPGRKKKSTP